MAVKINIERFRGDTIPDEFAVVNENNVAVDITGASFLLTINTLKTPANTATQVLQLVGTLTNPTGGVVQFAPTALEADLPIKKYYYDVQMNTVSGDIHTIAYGTYEIVQDITKT